MVHPSAVFIAGGNDINSCCVDTAVAKNIRQFGDILFDTVKHSCKQVAQVVRKDLLRIDIGFSAQRFHFTPNIGAAYWLARPCHKNHAVFYLLLRCVREQLFLQFLDNKN